MVYDEEGRRVPNQPVSWSIDVGTIVDSDALTDDVGEAKATVRSSTNHETGTVWAQTGTVTAYGWVEYGNEGDPSILPESFSQGQVLSGDVELTYSFSDPDAGTEYLRDLQLFIDGQLLSVGFYTNPTVYWNTVLFTNGTHTVQAKISDGAGNTMYSPVTTVTVNNPISSLGVTSYEVDPTINLSTTITAELSESADWQLDIKDSSGNTIVSTTGTGSNVSYTWDGVTAVDDDLFAYTITANSGSISGTSEKGYISKSVVPDSQVQVLCTAGENIPGWSERILPLYKWAKVRGYKAKRLPWGLCTWERLRDIMQNGQVFMVQIFAHCGVNPYSPYGGGSDIWKTAFIVKGGRIVTSDNDGLNYPNPLATVQQWGFQNTGQIKFAFLDGCQSAYFGTNTGQTNDMARAFGMYSDVATMNQDQTYMGWKDFTYNDSVYQGWIDSFYNYWHVAGRTLWYARFLTVWNGPISFAAVDLNCATFGYPLSTFF